MAAGTPASENPDWSQLAAFVIDRWPMPLAKVELTQIHVTVNELEEQRQQALDAMLRQEYGFDDGAEGWLCSPLPRRDEASG